MRWGDAQNLELLDFYRKLNVMRRSAPALWRGTRKTLATDDQAGLYAYGCSDGTREAIVALNNGGHAQRFPAAGRANVSPDPGQRGSDRASMVARSFSRSFEGRAVLDGMAGF